MMESPWDEENRWAVYPIEKIEAAIANLNEAIVMARQVQAEANARKAQARAELALKREQQVKALQECSERDLDKILCRGCRDHLPRMGDVEPIHIWLDGCNTEPCTASPERKKQLREYFEKEIVLTRRANESHV
jgi:hypothetical protein